MQTLTLDVDGPLARLTLDRPDKLNALSPHLLGEIIEAASLLTSRSDVRVVIVAGAGRAFCAGFDLGAFAGGERDPRESADLGRRMAEALTGIPQLTIAAIHGHCVGGGVVLAAACDLRIAGEDAVFSIPEADLGIPLAWGGVPRLVRELGPAITKELILTCRPFDAGEARALRFVNRVVPAGQHLASAQELAGELLTKPAFVLRATKERVAAAIENVASTAGSERDADLLLTAIGDPESQQVAQRYLAARLNG